MSRARKLIEGIDDPEEFDVKGHLLSPVARLASRNGFVRQDRDNSEERWIKKLSNGNEAWLVTNSNSDALWGNQSVDYRDPRYKGGRNWNFILVRKVPRLDYETLATANELTMDTLLGAFLQRLATWPKDRPKPGE